MPKKCSMGRGNGFSDLDAAHARKIFSQNDIERELDHHDREFSAEFVTARDGRKPIPDEDGNIDFSIRNRLSIAGSDKPNRTLCSMAGDLYINNDLLLLE